jgi:RND family efflux transporter MFP subunit
MSAANVLSRLSGPWISATIGAVCLMIYPALAQQPGPEALEYEATVTAAVEGEVAPRLDGLLTKIHFNAGQLVNEGDLLFEFEASERELALALARARLKQAEAQLRLVEVNLKNAQTLQSRNITSEMQLLEAEAQQDIAAAGVEENRINVQMAELDLQKMKLYAPISGVISRSLVREGAYITMQAREQSTLATISQLDPVHVIGRVPAAGYSDVAEGADAREYDLLLPSGDLYPHKGRQAGGGYGFDPETGTVELTLEFPNPDLSLRPGLEVTVRSSAPAN